MTFIPNETLKDEMLATLGSASIEDLFADIPTAVRTNSWKVPPGESELDVARHLRALLSVNVPLTRTPQFVGGTLKPHYVPSFVSRVAFRQEFYTSYTPYQAEFAQGTLQALFEYQSLVSDLVELPIVNGSMYDYSTALAEAALMCVRVKDRKRLLVPQATRPERVSTIENYVRGHGVRIDRYGFDEGTGRLDLDDLKQRMGNDVAGIFVESPNLLGVLEDVRAVGEVAHDEGALLVQGFDVSSLGLVEAPGALGADVAVADGTTMAFPPGLGGPQLGVFACREEWARRMPGRLVGATTDRRGNRAFCMTLQTREQHIRRERATSNICTNQTLLAIAMAAHLGALGPPGIRELARLNFERAAQLRDKLQTKTEWKPAYSGPIYNEFVVRGPDAAEAVYDRVGRTGLTPGWPLGRALVGHAKDLVVCTTEIHTDQDHDRLVTALGAGST